MNVEHWVYEVLDKGLPFAIFYFAICLGLVIYTFIFLRTLSAWQWPSIKGVVTYSSVVETETVSPNSNVKVKRFKPDVRYEYEVDQKKYEGKRIRFFQAEGSGRKMAERDVERFSVGGFVDVFYNPKKPQESVLLTGVSRGGVLVWVVLIGFIISMSASL